MKEVTNPMDERDRSLLLEMNALYHYEHHLNDFDEEKVRMLATVMQNVRAIIGEKPVSGDVVIFTDRFGNKYENAHLQHAHFDGFTFSICEAAYTPFVSQSVTNDAILVDASGGAWHEVKPEEVDKFKFVGKKVKRFCAWGHGGMQANGAVDFPVVVNVWEYTEPQKKQE